MSLKIINVVGARPNFMKMAPIIKAMDRHPGEIEHLLVHTGQYYDEKMSKSFFVGNVMIDTLLHHKAMAEKLTTGRDMGLEVGNYAMLTLHRPSNVDDKGILNGIFEALATIGEQLPIVFSIHPRTRKMMKTFHV